MSHGITRPMRLAALAAFVVLSLALLFGFDAAMARADTLTLAGGRTTLTNDPGTPKDAGRRQDSAAAGLLVVGLPGPYG